MKDKEELDKRVYFVHIPKTGGNAIRNGFTPFLINGGLEKSDKLHRFGRKKAFRYPSHPSFDSSFFECYLDDEKYKKSISSFTCVRNPFDMLLSYYSHYVETPGKDTDLGWGNSRSFHGIDSFEQFIDVYTSIDPEDWHVPELCRNLFGQIFDDKGEPAVENVIYSENILECMLDLVYSETFKKGCHSSTIEGSEGLGFKSLNFVERKDLRKKLLTTMKPFYADVFVSNIRGPRSSRKDFMGYYNESMIKKVCKKCEWELDNFYESSIYRLKTTKGLRSKC